MFNTCYRYKRVRLVCCISYFHAIHKRFNDAYGPEVKVICLNMNFDAMPVDGIGKRSLKPLKVRMKNVGKWLLMKSINVINGAFGPVILNSDTELLRMMRSTFSQAGKDSLRYVFVKGLPLILPYYIPLYTFIYLHKLLYTSTCIFTYPYKQ